MKLSRKMKKIHRKRVRRVVVKSKSYLDSLQKKRTQFLTRIKRIDTRTIISIDEAGFYKQMVPTYGYCQVGKRLIAPTTSQRHHKYTVISAVSNKNVVAYKIFKGSLTKSIYLDFLKNNLIPSLKGRKFVLLSDNLRCHHSKEAKKLVSTNNGECIYTPPYSPDFNPIENVFSVIKNNIRKKCLYSVNLLLKHISFEFENFKNYMLKSMFYHSFQGNHASHDRVLLDRIAFIP